MDQDELITLAMRARKQAYAPYSSFAVGAALLTGAGEVVLGCNVENASYSLSNCAERTAVFSAIAMAKSEQGRQFLALAVVADTARPIPPCGACRQVLAEFCPDHMPVYLANLKGDRLVTTVGDLLPAPFNKLDLKQQEGGR